MERNQAMSVAVGVGAVGTALAYLAYSYANSNDDTSNIVDKPSNNEEGSYSFFNFWENSNTVENTKEEDDKKEAADKKDAANLLAAAEAAAKSSNKKIEMTKRDSDEIDKYESGGWSSWWQSRYEEQRNNIKE